MRFKRLAAAVMAATMCGSLLVGCGGNDNKSADNNENITATIKVWGPAEDQAEENGKWLQTMGSLSGGEKVKTQLMRLFIRDVSVLLLDELLFKSFCCLLYRLYIRL